MGAVWISSTASYLLRLARHNAAMTRGERLNLVNAVYTRDPRPIEENCLCYTCQHFSRAYLRHLIIAREMLSATLLSIHNLYTLIQLTREIRQAIQEGRFDAFMKDYLEKYTIIEDYPIKE